LKKTQPNWANFEREKQLAETYASNVNFQMPVNAKINILNHVYKKAIAYAGPNSQSFIYYLSGCVC
jgi:hypothetical protein